jgi:hypothetical protein
MRRTRRFRSILLLVVLAGLLDGMPTTPTSAQSELMRGDRMPYDAFDRMAKTDVEVPSGVIHVAFAAGDLALPKEKVLEWVAASAQAVSLYYGRFPVRSLRLLFVPVDGSRIRGGTTWGYRGAAIRIPLGRDAGMDDLKRDWILVHEMVHLALPDLDARYGWLSEGLAVYVEPIARAQAGQLAPKEIWLAMIRDMPQGLPRSGDQGLDNTGSWGRKYWGGAMFCLYADVEIRKATNNRVGLQDAMRGILAAGGNHEEDWPIERVLSTADKAVGVDALTKLREAWGSKPVTPDLDALWRDLGVRVRDGGIEFDDTAPLAAIRVAMTKARNKIVIPGREQSKRARNP